MFASKTLSEHLVRGVIGLGALALATALSSTSVLYVIALVPIGLLALRGCPMCWLAGLGETLVAKLRGRPAPSACIDGTCAIERARREG